MITPKSNQLHLGFRFGQLCLKATCLLILQNLAAKVALGGAKL